jgi:hypothetical protein
VCVMPSKHRMNFGRKSSGGVFFFNDVQLSPFEIVYSRPSGFHRFTSSEFWILESFPDFAAKT